MLALLALLVVLLMGHLAILAASQLRGFGHLGAIQICSNTWGLCDDPVWVGAIAAVLLATIAWARRSTLKRGPQSVLETSHAVTNRGENAQRAEESYAKMPGRLLIRPHPAEPHSTWGQDNFDIIEGERVVGRIYRLHAAQNTWIWGIMPDGDRPDRRGREQSYEKAKAAFWTAWQSRCR